MRVAERITQRFLDHCSGDRDEIRALLQVASSRSPALASQPCQWLTHGFLHTLAAYLHATQHGITRVDAIYAVTSIAAFTGRPVRLDLWSADQKYAHLLSIGEGLIRQELSVQHLAQRLGDLMRNLEKVALRFESPLRADLRQVYLHFAQGLLNLDGHRSLREELFFDELSGALNPDRHQGRGGAGLSTLVMPDLFGNQEPVKIYFIAVELGDAVQPGDPCFYSYIGTQMVAIPALTAGTVQALLVSAGELVPVGAPIAELRRSQSQSSFSSTRRAGSSW